MTKKRSREDYAKLKELAIQACVFGGMSIREAAAEADLQRNTVSRWVLQYRKDHPEAPQNPNAMTEAGLSPVATDAEDLESRAPGVDDGYRSEALAAVDAGESTLEQVKALYRDNLVRAEAASRAGHFVVAQRMSKAAVDLVPTIARIEKAHKEDDDTLHFSKEECESQMLAVQERFKKMAARPLLCSACSRQLSVDYGSGAKPIPGEGGV